MSTTGAIEREFEPNADDCWASVRDMPPNAKLVAKILDYEDTLTQSQIAEESLLPLRAVHYTLSQLEDENAVDSRFSLPDARKRLYMLNI